MAESPEGSRLSGLARSIDALFSAPPSAPSPPAPPPLDESALADDMFPKRSVAALPEPVDAVDAVDVVDRVDDRMPPPAVPAAGDPVHDDFDPLLSFESPWSEPGVEEADPLGAVALHDGHTAVDEPDVALEPVTEPLVSVESAVPEPIPAALAEIEPVAPTSPVGEKEKAGAEAAGPDAAGFLAAVDAYVAGDREQRERIESLAAGLRDKLALDPLADAVETLVRAAGDPPDRTYVALAAAIMNPAVASRLVQRMGRERESPRREEYMTICRRIGVVMANGLKGALTGGLEPSVRQLYRDALVSMGPVSRPIIEAMVEDENSFLAGDAVVMLGELGGGRAVELVTSALANTDPRVREKALTALGELGDEEAGRLTLGFFEDSDPKVRLAAARTAAKLRVERALRPILQLLEQEEVPAARVRLLQALGQLGDPGAVPAIEKHAVPGLFAKTDTAVRVAAYKALHLIGTPHARELVERAMNDKEPAVRAALRGLVREA